MPFVVNDTAGLLITVAVMAASRQDCRRLARDYERHPEVSQGIIRWAAIAGMTRCHAARRQARQVVNWP